ncbi:MAG: hypothetical protein F6K25_14710 [Okeania sp. SIO2G4]|uniref:hypothetical protein n=1 Tax=Okeania sp. SIO2F5 TaxID=2607794 RepID=UPI0013B5C897|nr:hypothetical protein [Okeania sp. SIO2F5]NEP73178.1 hypothetical protein [Okeania sp. SIO2G5]NEP94041.1 hypothetical protein [Okeania sp. SIO2F5]NEQ91872.1 hypothetical protein [Okeania sp. SIO2G4]
MGKSSILVDLLHGFLTNDLGLLYILIKLTFFFKKLVLVGKNIHIIKQQLI